MALATQCPHCHTTFRVAHDQLKLRAGMVRCGACKQVFNGVEHLLRPADAVLATLNPEPPTSSAIAIPAGATNAHPVAGASTPAALGVASEFAPVSLSLSVARAVPEVASADSGEPLDFGIFLEPSKFAPPHADDTRSEPAAEPTEPPDGQSQSTARLRSIDRAPDALPESLVQSARQPAFVAPTPADDSAFAAQRVPPSAAPSVAHVATAVAEEKNPLMPFADQETDIADRLTPPHHASAPAAPAPATDERSGTYDGWPTAPSDAPDPSFFSLDAAEAGLSDEEEPEFVRRGRRQQRAGRVLRVLMAVASVALLCGLLLQGIASFRPQIAGFIPALQPVLNQVCATIDCQQTRLSAQIDQLSIDANTELQRLTTGSDDYALVLLLRNRSSSNQSWPHIELTLNDATDLAVARRVFTPREYLPAGQNLVAGFPSQSEQPVRILFMLSQLKASSYRVAVFYP